MNNVIFIHAGNMIYDKYGFPNNGRCQMIVDEISDYIIKSKIYNDVKFISLELLGDPNIKFGVPKGKINYNGNNYLQWEFPTLQKIINYAKENPNDNILYLHTKGSSSSRAGHERAGHSVSFQWIEDVRNYQLYQNIIRYKTAIQELKTHDTCGAELIYNPVPHYSHNFWWATASHINTLVHPKDRPIIFDERHKCEFWVCSKSDGKYKSIFNIYNDYIGAVSFSKELYINKEKF
jgi:hypothetical protein